MNENHKDFVFHYKLASEVWEKNLKSYDKARHIEKKWWTLVKLALIFPSFSIFEEQSFDFLVKSVMGSVDIKFSNTAHIIQLSIYMLDSMVSIMIWYELGDIYTLPPLY